jgi:type III secretion system YscD/HrpQ family protein
MGAEFIAEEGVLKGLILSLERGEEWTIGRDPDLSSIAIEDPKASRLHMRIRKTDAGYLVENLSETNPVLIGGEPISLPTLLHEGDLLTIGGSVFRFYPEGLPGGEFRFEEAYPFEEEEAFSEEEPSAQPPEEEAPIEEPSKGEGGAEEKEELPLAGEEIFEEKIPSFEKEPEEERLEESLFEEPQPSELRIDLTQITRFILKVIAGPNTGAEFAVDLDHSYLVGTDTATCDIVFNDLSVSREHARLIVTKEGKITIQDLGSRNGVIVDKERIVGSKSLTANAVVGLGTSAFLLIDREAPAETIATPLFEAPTVGEVEERPPLEEEPVVEPAKPVAAKVPPRKPLVSAGALLLSLIICGSVVLLGIGLVSLLQTKQVVVPQKDRMAELEAVMKQFPVVRFTFNQRTGKLFLVGHVKTGVEHNELLHQLRGLGFLTGIDDNVVNDEAVWQEMNISLSKNPNLRGISMHSPEAGVFVVNGYLQTEQQASELTNFLNLNFNFLNRLQNRVVVEQTVKSEVTDSLAQQGLEDVNVDFTNGEMRLEGSINSAQVFEFNNLIENFRQIPGVRTVFNGVKIITPETGVMDLNVKYPNKRYRVTGYSTRGNVNVNVVINGRIISRGDCFDGFTVTSIQPNSIFLEREGLKYKIEYNKCKSLGVEE